MHGRKAVVNRMKSVPVTLTVCTPLDQASLGLRNIDAMHQGHDCCCLSGPQSSNTFHSCTPLGIITALTVVKLAR